MKDLAKTGLAIFYLGMVGPDGGNSVVKSHYFNVTAAGTPSRAPATIASTTGTTSATSISASVSTTSATTVIQASHTSTPAPTDIPPAPATAAPIGAIIGGVLGGLAILCTFAFVMFRQIRKTNVPKQSQDDHEYPYGAAISMTSTPHSLPRSRPQTFKELEGTSLQAVQPQELYAPPPPQYNQGFI